MEAARKGKAGEDGETHTKLWEAVTADPLDFNNWVALLSHVETRAKSLDTVTSVFDVFLLCHFPLCYGYWQKYVDTYKRVSAPDGRIDAALSSKLRDIFEKAVGPQGPLQYSIEMWAQYLTYLTRPGQAPAFPAAVVREAFERGAAFIGGLPDAGGFWSMYLSFESNESRGANPLALCSVYERALSCPLKNLQEIWDLFREFLRGCSASQLGCEPSEILARVEAAKNRSQEDYNNRAAFEQALPRQFFHVKPLDEVQLKTWDEYLDFETQKCQGQDSGLAQGQGMAGTNGPLRRADTLHERCLIACANYSNFWIRCALWKESFISEKAAEDVMERACTLYLQYRPDVHLFRAELLEKHGQMEKAERCFQHVIKELAPGLLEGIVRYGAFLQRKGDTTGALSLYSSSVEGPAMNGAAKEYLYDHMARFQARGDLEGAKETLRLALREQPSSLKLWIALCQLERQSQAGTTRLLALVEEATHAKALNGSSGPNGARSRAEDRRDNMSPSDQALLWEWCTEALEESGASVEDLVYARGQCHQLAMKSLGKGNRKDPRERKTPPHVQMASQFPVVATASDQAQHWAEMTPQGPVGYPPQYAYAQAQPNPQGPAHSAVIDMGAHHLGMAPVYAQRPPHSVGEQEQWSYYPHHAVLAQQPQVHWFSLSQFSSLPSLVLEPATSTTVVPFNRVLPQVMGVQQQFPVHYGVQHAAHPHPQLYHQGYG
ncbi:unnamed protein product [Chrysoparadoxa australica]